MRLTIATQWKWCSMKCCAAVPNWRSSSATTRKRPPRPRSRRRHRCEQEGERPQRRVARDLDLEGVELGLFVEESQQRVGDRVEQQRPDIISDHRACRRRHRADQGIAQRPFRLGD
jgi:hypothetical protein